MESGDHPPLPPKLDDIALEVVRAATKVHQTLGPGLLESAYRACLAHELTLRGLTVRAEVEVPIIDEGLELKTGFRIDLLVDECLVLELKATESQPALHVAQVLTYLRLSGNRLGLLLNFNVLRMKDGIRRLIL